MNNDLRGAGGQARDGAAGQRRVAAAGGKPGRGDALFRAARGGGEWVAAFGDLLTAAIVAPEPAERAEAIMERVRGLARLPLAGRTEAQG